MTLNEKRFYFVHKPTGKFCYFEWDNGTTLIYLLDEFEAYIAYKARNVLEEVLSGSFLAGVENQQKFGSIPKRDDFELKECNVTYEY